MIKNRITSIVICSHLLFVAILLFSPYRPTSSKVSSLKVHTIHPSTLKKTVSSISNRTTAHASSKKTPSPRAKPVMQTAQKKKALPAVKPQKKEALHSTATTAAQKKSLPSPSHEKPPLSLETWKEIDQVLAKIEKTSYLVENPPPESAKLPSSLDEIEKEGVEDPRRVLMKFFHDTLSLPETGEVKLQLTIRKDGSIAKIVVISSESKKNELYLQKQLPLLSLPMHLDQENTWTLTFCHEET